MKLYQDVFKQSWRHTIQRPGLWIFGFFATFVVGAAGEIDRYLRFLNASLSDGHFTNPASWASGQWVDLLSKLNVALTGGNVAVWALLGLVVAAALLLGLMIAISVGALIHSTVHGTESFSEAFMAGRRHWLQLVSLFVPMYLLTVALTLGLAGFISQMPWLGTEANGQLMWLIVGGIILIPFVIGLSLWVRYAALAVVVEEKHLGEALKRGWQLLSHHWLVSFEMTVVNFLMATVVNLMVLIGLVLVFIPMLSTMGAENVEWALLVGQITYGLLALLSGAILSTWQWSAWTVLFQTLQQEKPNSTLVRWAESIR